MDTDDLSPIFCYLPSGPSFILRKKFMSRYMFHIAAFHQLAQSKKSASSSQTSEIDDLEILRNFPLLRKHWLGVLREFHSETFSCKDKKLLSDFHRAMIQDLDSSWDGSKHDMSYPERRRASDVSEAEQRLEAVKLVLEIRFEDAIGPEEQHVRNNLPQELRNPWQAVQEMCSLLLEANVGFEESRSIMEATLTEIAKDHTRWLGRFAKSGDETSRKKTRR